jgi:hypothetical protein
MVGRTGLGKTLPPCPTKYDILTIQEALFRAIQKRLIEALPNRLWLFRRNGLWRL